MKPIVFFSYSRQDSEFALKLGKDLRASGISIWLDQLDIKPGERWDVAIEKTLAECSRILVVLSPASVESTNVMDEVSYALEERRVVIPVLHRDCEIPFRLRRLQHTDFRTDYQTGLDKLLQYLNAGPAAIAAAADKPETDGKETATRGPPGKKVWVIAAAAVVAVLGVWAAVREPPQPSNSTQTPENIADASAPPPAPTTESAKPAEPTEPTPRAVVPPGDEPRVRVVNSKSGLCLTPAGGGKDLNAEIVQYPCDDDPSRFWSTSVVPDTGMVTIKNLNSELCLTIAGGSSERNVPAVQYFCDGDPSRNWHLRKFDETTFRLVNEHSNLCLTTAGGVTDRNAVAVQYPCDGDPSRDWQIRRDRR